MSDVSYPEDPPVWLDKWLTEAEISSRFSDSIPSMAFKAFTRSNNLALSFTPRCLHATIDNQHARWRLDDVRGWECECSCHSPVPCVHAYMATIMFQKACKDEGWQLPTSAKKNVGTIATATFKPPSVANSANVETAPKTPERPAARQLSFFSEGNVKPSANAVATKTVHCCELECRVDCISSNSSIVVMFRTMENGVATDRRLSWIRECAYELEKDLNSLYEWSESDSAFLTWILSYMRKVSLLQLNGYKWFVPFGDFGIWMQRYSEMTGRMIDDRIGLPLGKIMPFYPQTFFLRLLPVPAGVRIEFFFKNSDGSTIKYHEMRNMEQEDGSKFILSFFKGIFKWPVDRMHFMKFSNGPVTMNAQNVCDFLKETLDGHFELIEEGRLVVRERSERTPISVEVSSDGWTFRVVCRDSLSNQAPSSLCLRGGIFHVVVYDKLQESIGDLRQKVDKLHTLAEEFRSHTRGYYRDGVYSCRALPENASALQSFWTKLPSGVKKVIGNGMEGLLGKTGTLKLDISLKEHGSFVSAFARCSCGGESIEMDELLSAARHNTSIIKTSRGSWFMLNADDMAKAVQDLNEFGLLNGDCIMFPDEAAKMVKSFGKSITVADNSVALAQRLKNTHFPDAISLPSHFGNILRSYQKYGFSFLAERTRYGVGTILADDMGLGKTIQVLALLEAYNMCSTTKFRALVVAPATVVDVWLNQAKQFCRALRVVAMRGSHSQRIDVLNSDDYDLMVTHYGLVRADVNELSQFEFDFVILDEAQAIKNPDAQISTAVRALKTKCRLALTGTPLENRLRDLWSIMDFVNPGFWGTWNDFEIRYDNTGGFSRMRQQLRMLMLRRKKEAVDLELPAKTVEVVSIDMDEAVRRRYNAELLKARGMANLGDRISILAALTRLRMFCCAPELIEGAEGLESFKLEYMMESIADLLENGHSILVFSQFTSMLEIVERRLEQASIRHFKITGDTPVVRRGGIVKEFNESEKPSVFLLSLKAAGTGLTLTKADYVFMYDPWWNPAAENQAIDRTHRIGQDKPVFAYRLMVKGTVEEKVMQIVESKRKLFNEVIDEAGSSGGDSRLTIDELKSLLD